ncbi:MAG: protease modulator HflC [Oscillospiraceae bacterium]|nr:protease modulator HflC [Oscillospiraceae bacterium]
MNTKKITIRIVIIAAAVIAISILSSAFYTVQENEYALVIRFSKVVDTIESPGLHFKIPVIDEVKYFPKTKLFYDIQPSGFLTKDSKNMTVDCFIVWRISDPFVFWQQLLGSVSNAEGRLDTATYNELQKLVGRLEQNEIIDATDEKSRDNINVVVTTEAKKIVAQFGIEILDIKVKGFELPHENEQAVFERMISDRERVARFERSEGEKDANIIRNEVDREVNIIVSNAKAAAEKIVAEGEAEYMRLLAESYSGPQREEFFSFMRGLDALKASLSGPGAKTVILDRDSLLARILVGP